MRDQELRILSADVEVTGETAHRYPLMREVAMELLGDLDHETMAVAVGVVWTMGMYRIRWSAYTAAYSRGTYLGT